jgi:hypothetical protein
MPKYLLLKHYRGGPEPHHPFPPMDRWAPEDVEAQRRRVRRRDLQPRRPGPLRQHSGQRGPHLGDLGPVGHGAL